jgi:hypothetical protein
MIENFEQIKSTNLNAKSTDKKSFKLIFGKQTTPRFEKRRHESHDTDFDSKLYLKPFCYLYKKKVTQKFSPNS